MSSKPGAQTVRDQTQAFPIAACYRQAGTHRCTDAHAQRHTHASSAPDAPPMSSRSSMLTCSTLGPSEPTHILLRVPREMTRCARDTRCTSASRLAGAWRSQLSTSHEGAQSPDADPRTPSWEHRQTQAPGQAHTICCPSARTWEEMQFPLHLHLPLFKPLSLLSLGPDPGWLLWSSEITEPTLPVWPLQSHLSPHRTSHDSCLSQKPVEGPCHGPELPRGGRDQPSDPVSQPG